MPLFHHFSDGTTNEQAIALLEEAVAREPDFALAHAYAAWAYERRDTFARPLEETEHRRCLELAKRALALGSDDPQIAAIGGWLLLAMGYDHAAGIAMAQRALEANPNNSVVLSQAALCDILAGDLDRGIAAYHRGYLLSPGSPDSYVFLSGIGFGHFFKCDFVAAVDWLQRAREARSDWPPTLWMLTAACAHLGRMDQARSTLLDLRRAVPYLDLDRMAYVGKRSDERHNLLSEGLRKAGLPETITP
jgi:tetratricopeptide (TPR) repeat protein